MEVVDEGLAEVFASEAQEDLVGVAGGGSGGLVGSWSGHWKKLEE